MLVKKENVFGFLMNKKISYILKGSKGNIIKKCEGELEIEDDNTLLFLTDNNEIKIRLDKAININLIEAVNYAEIQFSSSTVELKEEVTKESVFDDFIHQLSMYDYIVCDMFFEGFKSMNTPSEYFDYHLTEGILEVNSEKSTFEIDVNMIDTITKDYDNDEFLYIFKYKNNIEVYVGLSNGEVIQ